MSSNVEGFKYEKRVIEALAAAGVAGQIREGAGASSSSADADFVVNGERHLVEVKKDSFAQMGGTSVKYVNGEFVPVHSSTMDSDTVELVVRELQTKKEHVDRLISFLEKDSLPVSCEKDAWDTAKTAGLLRPINTKVRKDTSFLVEHYKSKGVDYIQIGNAGLFYLDKNPAKLPVPRLQGEVDIELRAGRSGSRKNSQGVSYVGGSLRAQGRLKFRGTSPFTLDSEDSIRKMMEAINGKK